MSEKTDDLDGSDVLVAEGPDPVSSRSTVLELNGLTKVFGSLRAVDGVSLKVHPGEIHALLGENGAGKSSLVKLIYGLLHPDDGSMRLGGSPFNPANPAAARAAGIGMVFQHFSLFDAMTVEENIEIALDAERTDNLANKIEHYSNAYGLALDARARINEQQQQ